MKLLNVQDCKIGIENLHSSYLICGSISDFIHQLNSGGSHTLFHGGLHNISSSSRFIFAGLCRIWFPLRLGPLVEKPASLFISLAISQDCPPNKKLINFNLFFKFMFYFWSTSPFSFFGQVPPVAVGHLQFNLPLCTCIRICIWICIYV